MNVSEAKIIPVIQIATMGGTGTEDDPVREVLEYWDVNGKLLFVLDAKKAVTINRVPG